MGIVNGPLAGDADQLQHFHGALDGLVLADIFMQADTFGDLLAHAHDRVQAGHGVLEDHGDVLAADLLKLRRAEAEHIVAADRDLAAFDDSGGIGHQVQQCQSRGGLACAGLADQADGLALFQLKADAVDGLDHLFLDDILDDEVFDLEDHFVVFFFRCSHSGLVFNVITHRSDLTCSASDPVRPSGRHPGG